MSQPKKIALTRRAFAATLLTGVAATVAATTSPTALSFQSPAAPPLSEPSQSEAAQRLQTILTLYGPRFSEAQKTDLKKICNSTQSSLDHLRSYKTQNSDDPALHLKPLIEHEKKPGTPNSKPLAAPAKLNP